MTRQVYPVGTERSPAVQRRVETSHQPRLTSQSLLTHLPVNRHHHLPASLNQILTHLIHQTERRKPKRREETPVLVLRTQVD